MPAATPPAVAGPSCVEAEDGEEEGREEDCCWPAGGSGVRRPMNAFFLFCKRHRSVVRERYPHLENRAITKILGEWWASLEAHEKHTYTELAKQYKEAFMKANPDFKWCKMPTLPTRSPVTRTKGATTKGADTLRWSPPDEQTNCPPRSDMPRLPTLTKDPLSVSRQHNSSSPVLQQQQAAPPDELPPAKPMTESGGNAASEPAAVANPAPPNNPPPMSCKPPKKRYLENLENGTYGGGAAGRLKSESSSSPSPTPSPVPCAPLQRAASTDQQTNNACSALLELAEGCQTVKKPPTVGGRQKASGDWNAKSQDNSGGTAPSSAATSTATTTTSTLTSSSNGSSGHCGGSVPPAGFGPIPMFDVSAANRIIDQAFSQPTTTASSTSVTPPPFAPLSTSSATTPPPCSGGAPGGGSSLSKSARDRFFNVSSAQSLAQSLSRSDDEQPLNLSKERPMTTIKASQQDIINHIIDKFLCGPSNVEPLDGTVFSAHGSARHPDDSPAVPAVVAAAIPGTQPAPNAGYYRGADGDDDGDDGHRKVGGGSKGAGVRRKAAAGSSPNKRARVSALPPADEDGGSSPERARKSQRSCKGQRYQALLSEGMLPGSKERKGTVRKSDEEGDDEPSRLGPGGPLRREDGAKVPRKNSGSFNLDAQIAALPKCNMETFTRRKSKKKAGGRPEDEGRDDRFSPPVDPADLGGPRDPSDLRSAHHRGSSMRQRCDSGASGTDEATVDDPCSPPVPSPGDHSSSLTPRKFKTGDFDLDEHLAALPKCDIEVLSRRKKELRRDSGSSSGKQDSKGDESGTESEHAGASESTEENGVREEWPSGEEEEEGSEEAGPTSPKKDKRKRRKGGGLMEEDFPSSLATLADIALSQKEKMQD